MKRFQFTTIVRGCVPVLLLASMALARQPVINLQIPQGGQRGTVLTLDLRGQELQNPEGILFYEPGIELVKWIPVKKNRDKVVKARIRIADDCRLGEHVFRLHTPRGLSEARTFYVGTFPEVSEEEPNSSRDTPQDVELNQTITGSLPPEDIDFFRFAAKQGDVISLEAEATRLGNSLLDTYLAVMDSNRFELAVCDDSPLTKQDPFLSFTVPADGQYLVEFRESAYEGNKNGYYRLHLGHFPRPQTIVPPGGRPGETLMVEMREPLGRTITREVTLPEAEGTAPVWAVMDGQEAPSPNWMRVVDCDWIAEQEPNQWNDHAQVIDSPPPFAVYGQLEPEDADDLFRFHARKNEMLEIQVYGRRLGSSADPVARLLDAKGKQVAFNDDQQGIDPVIKYRPKKDGDLILHVSDRLKQGGDLYGYCVEVRRAQPGLALYQKYFRQRTQFRHGIPVPLGGQSSILLQVRRQGQTGAVQAALQGLPEGWLAEIPPTPKGQTQVPVLLRAPDQTNHTAFLIGARVETTEDKRPVTGFLDHDIHLVYGEPNNALYHSTPVDQLAVSTMRALPYRVELQAPETPAILGGSVELTVKLHRNEGFNRRVKVRLLYVPKGLGAVPEKTIAANANETSFRITVGGKSAIGTWPMAVIAAQEQRAPLDWVASDFCTLEVVDPYVRGELEMTVVERKQGAEVVCRLNVLKHFDGEGTIELLGLPPGVTCDARTITAESTQVVFQIHADESSPTGTQKSLFCDVRIPHGEGTMQQSIAAGGVLRVDPVRASSVAGTGNPKKNVAEENAVKPPSRLEQLRQKKQRAKEKSS